MRWPVQTYSNRRHGSAAAARDPIDLDWAKTGFSSSSTCSANFMEPRRLWWKRWATMFRKLARAVQPIAAVLGAAARTAACSSSTPREGHLPDLSRRTAGPRSNRGRAEFADWRSRPNGADSDPRRSRPTTLSPALLSARQRDRHRQAWQGCVFTRPNSADVPAEIRHREFAGVRPVTTEGLRQHHGARGPTTAATACVVLAEMACASYFPEFHEMGLNMIKGPGWASSAGVSDSAAGSQGNDTGRLQTVWQREASR